MISNVRQGQRITAGKTNEIIDAVNSLNNPRDCYVGSLPFDNSAVPDGVAFNSLEFENVEILSDEISDYNCG